MSQSFTLHSPDIAGENPARMKRALEAMVIEGIKTTVPLHLKIMDDPRFRAGDIDTDFMEYFLAKNGKKAAGQ